jgi:hypothetical protein
MTAFVGIVTIAIIELEARPPLRKMIDWINETKNPAETLGFFDFYTRY